MFGNTVPASLRNTGNGTLISLVYKVTVALYTFGILISSSVIGALLTNLTFLSSDTKY